MPSPVHLPSRSFGPPFGEKSIRISPSPRTSPSSDHSLCSSPFEHPGVPSAPRTVSVAPEEPAAISRAQPGCFGSEYRPTRTSANFAARAASLSRSYLSIAASYLSHAAASSSSSSSSLIADGSYIAAERSLKKPAPPFRSHAGPSTPYSGASMESSAARETKTPAPHARSVLRRRSTIGRTVYVPRSRSLASISGSFTYTCPSYQPVSSYSTVADSSLSRT
mmetsp:Transcript_1423/g.5810  ORF Transcript_1423/g.5810 Transcript_1423/m.5810 type:complete len:222 (+) Transcript_1423:182-847(+)